MSGELGLPAGTGKHPVVILLHGCGGLALAVPASLRAHSRMLRRHGFATLILDSFGPRGISGGWVCDRNSRLASATHYRQRDVRDAIQHLKSHPQIDIHNTFLMGQSNGAGVAAEMARGKKYKNIRAAVAFYPWCGSVWDRSAKPLLVLAGGADDWTPPEGCRKRHNPASGITVHVYPDATHSFDLDIPELVYKGHRLKGDKQATGNSRKRMVRFFRQNLKD
ncbi:MAG: dienelactone hydrolase family protein [Pseudomonadota bacterium]